MLKELTIVIPTHNRHTYLNRLLDYYSDVDLKILIADSSSTRYENKLSKNVEYFFYPNMELLKKINHIFLKVTTEYLIICADDDFWVKESLIECLSFLKDNADYASVQGKSILFSKIKNSVSFTSAYSYAIDINLMQDNCSERVRSLMSTYVPLFYSMHRSKHIQEVSSDCVKFNINHAILIELLFSLYTIIDGKNKTLELLVYARDNISLSSDVDRTNLYDIHYKGMFSDEYSNFKMAIVNYINKFENHRVVNINNIESILSVYLNTIEYKKRTFSSRIKKIIPSNVYNFFRKIKYRFFTEKLNDRIVNQKGYPITDNDAINSWNNIQKIIQKYNI